MCVIAAAWTGMMLCHECGNTTLTQKHVSSFRTSQARLGRQIGKIIRFRYILATTALKVDASNYGTLADWHKESDRFSCVKKVVCGNPPTSCE